MSFNMSNVGGFGESESTFTPDAANVIINSYAKVDNIDGKVLTISGATNHDAFQTKTRVLVHVSGYNGTASYCRHIGKWLISYITAVDRANGTITIWKNANSLKDAGHVIQVVTIPEYGTLTLNAGKSITCPQFNLTSGGGIVALICSEELVFNGGHINLAGKGLPDTSIRTPLNQEAYYLPQQIWSGYENYQTKDFLTLNCPDGAAMIFAQKVTCHENSRIGNPNLAGKQRIRGYRLDPNNVNSKRIFGGSSIMLVAEEIVNFTPGLIAKYSSQEGLTSGGLCRAYIATETTLPNDEGLYALDRITDKYRLSSELNISSYGDGSNGSQTNYVKLWNTYGMVNEVSVNKKSNKVTALKINTIDDARKGLAKIKQGALIMIQTVQKRYVRQAGRFWLTTVAEYDALEGKITLKDPIPYDNRFNLDYYYVQVIAIPQFENFTLAKNYSAVLPFHADYGGGVAALACSDTLTLSGGKILTANATGGDVQGYGATGLDYISNAGMATRLPLGEGYGSVFILAKNLVMDADTRIGAFHSGKGFGGGGYGWGADIEADNHGSGLRAGAVDGEPSLKGGFGSSAVQIGTTVGGRQGAHIFIVADKITGLNLAALSTGGQGAQGYRKDSGATFTAGDNGGCGYGGEGGEFVYNNRHYYGGDGGYHGGGAGAYVVGRDSYAQGGGAGGFCFIYCNSHSDQDAENLSIS